MPMPVFDKQEDIPDAFRGEYVEREENGVKKWHLNVEDVSGLKSALDRQKEDARAAKEARAAAERERDELRRTAEARAKGISDEDLQKIRDDEARARQPIIERAETAEKKLRALLLKDRANQIAKDNGAYKADNRMAEAIDHLILTKRLDLSDADEIVVYGPDGKLTAQTADEFFKTTLKNEKKWLYEGTGSSGSGSSGSDTSAGSAAAAKSANEYVAQKNKAGEARPNPLRTAGRATV